MNLPYEIAKKLKDLGFPQKMTNRVCQCNKPTYRDGMTNCCGHSYYQYAYAPTLEELIEACGEGLNVMERDSGGWQVGIQQCEPYEGCWLDVFAPNGEGQNLVEAVANLWLALNSK